MLTDPIADMLTRIRNANKAMHDRADMPTSRLKEQIARILKEEGYIRDFKLGGIAKRKAKMAPGTRIKASTKRKDARDIPDTE